MAGSFVSSHRLPAGRCLQHREGPHPGRCLSALLPHEASSWPQSCAQERLWWSRPPAGLPPTGVPLRCSHQELEGQWGGGGETSSDGSDSEAVTPDDMRATSVCRWFEEGLITAICGEFVPISAAAPETLLLGRLLSRGPDWFQFLCDFCSLRCCVMWPCCSQDQRGIRLGRSFLTFESKAVQKAQTRIRDPRTMALWGSDLKCHNQNFSPSLNSSS